MTQDRDVRSRDTNEEFEREENPGAGEMSRDGSVEVESRPRGMSDGESLLSEAEGARLRARWESIQASFVDQPRESVSEAEALLSEVLQSLANGFSRQRSELEARWGEAQAPSTEDMRLTVKRYRTMFERLLAA